MELMTTFRMPLVKLRAKELPQAKGVKFEELPNTNLVLTKSNQLPSRFVTKLVSELVDHGVVLLATNEVLIPRYPAFWKQFPNDTLNKVHQIPGKSHELRW